MAQQDFEGLNWKEKLNKDKAGRTEETLSALKAKALGIDGVYFPGIRERQKENGEFEASGRAKKPSDWEQPLSWNENSGVIQFTDQDGKEFCMPSNNEVREMLRTDPSFIKKEGKSVLNLSEVSVWGGSEEAEKYSAYQEWQKLLKDNEPVRKRDEEEWEARTRESMEDRERESADHERADDLADRIKNGTIGKKSENK